MAPREGRVELYGHAFRDQAGPYLSLGASLFWLAWGFRSDRARLTRNLRFLADEKIGFVRALAVVGPGRGWDDRVVDPAWPDFADVIGGATRLAHDAGLRVAWTIFGGVDHLATARDRDRVVSQVIGALRGLEHAVEYLEMANEGEGNGFPGEQGRAELDRHAKACRAAGWPIVALTAAPYADDLGQATVRTVHPDRDDTGEGGEWQYVRQPWSATPPFVNGEPKGPQSSVAEDDDPVRLTMAAAVTWLSGGAAHVLHTGAGVRGGGAADLAIGRPANLWDVPRIKATLAGLRAGRAVLPADLPNWNRRSHSHPKFEGAFPFRTGPLDRLWDTHFMRIYAASRDGRFVALPLRVRRSIPLTAVHAMRVEVRHPLDGRVLATRRLAAGHTITLVPEGATPSGAGPVAVPGAAYVLGVP